MCSACADDTVRSRCISMDVLYDNRLRGKQQQCCRQYESSCAGLCQSYRHEAGIAQKIQAVTYTHVRPFGKN
jgi:hypothetical protein